MNTGQLVCSHFWASGPLRIPDWQIERVVESLQVLLDVSHWRFRMTDAEYTEWMDRVSACLRQLPGADSAMQVSGPESLVLGIVALPAAGRKEVGR